MEVELIPDTGVYEKDVKKFKLVRKDNGETHYYVTLKNNGGRCPICGKFTTKCKELKVKRIILAEKKIIHYSARRLKCECNKTFYEDNPFIKDEKILSDNAIKLILKELKRYNHTFLEVAQRFNISVTKVIEIFDCHVQIKRKSLREVISVDEFYFSRRSKNKYAFMILGLNGEILDILKSRKKAKLLDYFKYIPLSERDRVKYVTMDMNDIYKDVINRRFKDVTICIDSFHVIKMMNDELEKLRKKLTRKYENNKKSNEYYLLKHKNYVLYKEELNENYHHSKHFHYLVNDLDYLNMILKIDDKLTNTYQEIRRYYYFNKYWYEYTKDEVLDYLSNYIDELFLSNNEYLINIASTLNNWKKEIANSFISYARNNGETTRLSNGRIEGKNSYIKKMLNLANGYSNFERFRNRAMYCENLYETHSVDKLPNKVKRIFPKKKTTVWSGLHCLFAINPMII